MLQEIKRKIKDNILNDTVKTLSLIVNIKASFGS